MAGRDPDSDDPYTDELAHIDEDLRRSGDLLNRYVAELNQLGIEPRDASVGLVDFPALLADREVYLSWELGEAEVSYWHELGDASDKRRLIEGGSLEAASFESGSAGMGA